MGLFGRGSIKLGPVKVNHGKGLRPTSITVGGVNIGAGRGSSGDSGSAVAGCLALVGFAVMFLCCGGFMLSGDPTTPSDEPAASAEADVAEPNSAPSRALAAPVPARVVNASQQQAAVEAGFPTEAGSLESAKQFLAATLKPHSQLRPTTTVYLTPTGDCYHSGWCRHVKDSSRHRVDYWQAIRSYKDCGHCSVSAPRQTITYASHAFDEDEWHWTLTGTVNGRDYTACVFLDRADNWRFRTLRAGAVVSQDLTTESKAPIWEARATERAAKAEQQRLASAAARSRIIEKQRENERSARNYLESAQRLLAEGKLAVAEQQAKLVVSKYDQTPSVAEAAGVLKEIARLRKENEPSSPQMEKKAAALLRSAKDLLRRKRTKAARHQLEQLQKKYPNTDAATEAARLELPPS